MASARRILAAAALVITGCGGDGPALTGPGVTSDTLDTGGLGDSPEDAGGVPDDLAADGAASDALDRGDDPGRADDVVDTADDAGAGDAHELADDAGADDAHELADDAGADDADDALEIDAPAGIGPTGGTLSWDEVRLVVPPGALDRWVDIRISAPGVAIPPPPGVFAWTNTYRFEPDGLTFAVPARVEFRAVVADGLPHVFWSDTVEPIAFAARESSVDGAVVRAEIDHFSLGFVGTFEAEHCAGLACTTPPPTLCSGSARLFFDAEGACETGVCVYSSHTVACGTGESCVDGVCRRGPSRGELVITEVFSNPIEADRDLEWFEVMNVSGGAIDLIGLSVQDATGGESFVVDEDLVLGAGAVAVFAETADAAPGRVTFAWNAGAPAFTLANDADVIEVAWGGATIDRVAYDGSWSHALAAGRAASLSSRWTSAESNDSPSHWCGAASTYGVGENLGTPGAANPSCDPCDGVVCITPPSPYCTADGDGVVEAASTGSCSAGTCAYAEAETRCGALEECVDGACAPRDPCDGVVCDEPAPARCAGGVAVAEQPAGACSAGVCFYDVVIDDCAGAGAICVAGACVSGPTLFGDLVVTEIMANPEGSDADLEWFEVVNASGRPLNLRGLEVSDDGGERFTVGADTWVDTGAYAVLAEAPSGDRVTDFAWNPVAPGFALANADDEVTLMFDGLEIDRVAYDSALGWPSPESASFALDPGYVSATDNDDGSLWCRELGSFGASPARGTPGRVNSGCGLEFAAPAAGELIISEFLANPQGDEATLEWIEVRSAADGPRRVTGLRVHDDGGDGFDVDVPVVLSPGEHFLLLKSPAAVPTPRSVSFAWGGAAGMTLANDGDEIVLTSGATVIDRVAYDGAWPVGPGVSTAFYGTDADDNGDPAWWCAGAGDYGVTGERGTPGDRNGCAP